MGKKRKKPKKYPVSKDNREIIQLHERLQKSSKSNSPNIKTRTSGTKRRWKGWRYYEEPSEVITYSIDELNKKS